MKKLIMAAIAALGLSLASCSTFGLTGGIYTELTGPEAATSNTVGYKVGQSKVTSVLGLVALGDGGINAAVKSAGITKVSHVDVNTYSLFNLFTVTTTYVYGE